MHPLGHLSKWLRSCLLLAALVLIGCDGQSGHPAMANTEAELRYPGDAESGADLIGRHGCGSCHRIPGIESADGNVGPPLDNLRARGYLAGILPNSYENLVLWLMETQRIAPGSAMPDLGLSEAEARHIAAYLYQQE